MEEMGTKEASRMILDLRAKGWTDTEIINHILYVETGEEQYKAGREEKN